MARAGFQLGEALADIGLEELEGKFAALGIRSADDFQYVEDGDLVTFGLTTIQRRRFFRWRESHEGASAPASSSACRPRAAASAFPSASSRVRELAARVLERAGPQTTGGLRARLEALGAGGVDDEALWEALEGLVEALPGKSAENGEPCTLIALRQRLGGAAMLSVDAVVFRLGDFLALRPEDLLRLGSTCRAVRSSGISQAGDLWLSMLRLWFPRASLENPEAVERARESQRTEEQRIDELIEGLCASIGADVPSSFAQLCCAAAADLQGRPCFGPRELLRVMARRTQVFRQRRGDGGPAARFCLRPEAASGDWEAVNPYQDPASLLEGGSRELEELEASAAAEPPRAAGAAAAAGAPEAQLHPLSAFRLFHTGLLTDNVSQPRSLKGGRGKTRGTPLRSWEYLTESNSRGVRAPAELLDEAEKGVIAVRANDPSCVHALVVERLVGAVYHVQGCYRRRVQILTAALQGGSELVLERETHKQMERKLLEFMEHVRKERAFGHYYCADCRRYWRSGFTYEEMCQACSQCGAMVKPYRITELKSSSSRPGAGQSSVDGEEAWPRSGGRGWQQRSEGAERQRGPAAEREAASDGWWQGRGEGGWQWGEWQWRGWGGRSWDGRT